MTVILYVSIKYSIYRLLCNCTVLKKNPASAKIVKIEFNANLDLQGFPHFIAFNECRNCLEMKENDTEIIR